MFADVSRKLLIITGIMSALLLRVALGKFRKIGVLAGIQGRNCLPPVFLLFLQKSCVCFHLVLNFHCHPLWIDLRLDGGQKSGDTFGSLEMLARIAFPRRLLHGVKILKFIGNVSVQYLSRLFVFGRLSLA